MSEIKIIKEKGQEEDSTTFLGIAKNRQKPKKISKIKNKIIIITIIIILSLIFFLLLSKTKFDKEDLYFTEKGHRQLSRKFATEGIVLARNRGLPIEKTDKVVLFGKGTKDTIYGGFGSGEVYKKGKNENIIPIKVFEGIENKAKEKKFIYQKNNKGYEVGSNLTNTDISKYSERGNAKRTIAILTISRRCGETKDRNKGNDIRLSIGEMNTYRALVYYFDCVVIILNVPSVMEISSLLNNEKTSIIISFLPGVEAGNAIADILVGDVNPSGHLSDTWAKKIDDYPTTETFFENKEYVKYKEGIFVGYRFFEDDEIKQSKIVFPFGFGLSYTTFKISNNCNYLKGIFFVNSTVTNTGNRKGKEVVQVYIQKPQNENFIKAKRELIAFAKTKELSPKESQTLNMTFKLEDLASYDDTGVTGFKSCYVLEKGDYNVYVGTNVADTRKMSSKVYTYKVEKLIVIKKFLPRLKPKDPDIIDSNRRPDFNKFMYKNFISKTKINETLMKKEKNIKNETNIRSIKEIVNKENKENLKSKENLFGFKNNINLKNNKDTKNSKKMRYLKDKKNIKNNKKKEFIRKKTIKNNGKNKKYCLNTNSNIDIKENNLTVNTKNKLFNNQSFLRILSSNINEINFKTVLEKKYTMEELLNSMSNEELAYLTYGHEPTPGLITGKIGGLYNKGITGKYLIPSGDTTDGPAGLRQTKKSMASVAWPCSTLLASTFDVELMEILGKETGKEARKVGTTFWLAPGMNIHRNPLCGRNFEYYSEDPFLTGKLAAAITRGFQSKRVSITLKHFAFNDKEDNRKGNKKLKLKASDSRMSERVAREIHLKGFEIAVKEGNPWSIMTSYNRINGEHTSVSYDLITGILRKEWGFNGLVMTDWNTFSDIVDEIKGGGNIKMPNSASKGSMSILNAIKTGKIKRYELINCGLYICNILAKTAAIDNLLK